MGGGGADLTGNKLPLNWNTVVKMSLKSCSGQLQQKQSIFRTDPPQQHPQQSRQVSSDSDPDSDYDDISQSTLISNPAMESDHSGSLDDSGPALVKCPNKCGKFIERISLKSHISVDCPMTIIDCEFKYVGCDIRFPRKDMLMHTEQAVIYHLTKQVGNYEQRIKTLEADNRTLSLRCETLEAQQIELVRKVSEAFDKISQLVDTKGDDRKHGSDDDQDYVNMDEVYYESVVDEDCSYVSAIKPATASLVPKITDFTMNNFQFHKENDDNWVSRPFYTHSQGYKMCLRVIANGQGSGKGTHITVAVYLMKGEFDNHLEWPFRGDITIQLLNQQEDGGHYTRTIYQAKGERSKATVGEKHICGWGINKFLVNSELFPKYLQNDSLRFRISVFVKSKPNPDEMIETEV